MAPSVLGKRARPTESTKELSPISSRVKRRAILPITNDENADPNLAPNGDYDTQYDDGMQVDALETQFLSSSKYAEVVKLSAKRFVDKGRDALSPAKIKGHFKTTKAVLKQGKEPSQLATPQTHRYRDALSKKVPITPCHRVGLIGKYPTPHTPRTPSTPSNTPTVYNVARQLFTRNADPGRLIGRETERQELKSFLHTRIQKKTGQCLYVSGPPGTGKSALVSEVCHEVQESSDVQSAYINCMSVKNSKDIYRRLIRDLTHKNGDFEDEEIEQLKAIFIPKKNSPGPVYVVTLDEIDHLLTLDLEILYSLFEWSIHRYSRLILVGIANALDLTDRFLPRLKARNLKPQLLPFLPYTAPQIASVITTKLQTLPLSPPTAQPDYLPFLHPAAVQFCAKKVASQTGDLRKAFDIIRRTIDLVEIETKEKYQAELGFEVLPNTPSKAPLHENPNISSPSRLPANFTKSLSTLTPSTAPRATIAHVARVSASALSHGAPQRLQTLNLQQKAALCALISLEKSNHRRVHSIFATPSKANLVPTIRKLYEKYCLLCKRENALHPLTTTEFADVVGGLETLGLIGGAGGGKGVAKVTPGKKSGKSEDRRIVSSVSEAELEGCLEGVGGGILRGLLEEHE